MLQRWPRSGQAAELDWVTRPPEPSLAERLWRRLRALLAISPFRPDAPDNACPFCFRSVRGDAARCPRCGELLTPEDAVAALRRLGVAWPEPVVEFPDIAPDALAGVDPERLRLRELAQEEIFARGHAFAALASLGDPRLGASLERYPHQVATVQRVLGELGGRAILADEVGLGKTIEAGLILAELRARNLCGRALILVPPALLDQWEEELGGRLGLPVRRVESPRAWERPPEVALLSIFTAKGGRHSTAIQAQPWDLVIVDEAHRLRNRRTQMHQFVRTLRARSLLLLTATPMHGSALDLYALAGLVRPGLLGTPGQFRTRFGITDGGRRIRRARELRGVLREVMVRNRRATAGVYLPPRYAAVRWLSLPPEERVLHDAALYALREAAAGGRPTFGRLAALQRRLTSTPQAAAAALAWLTDAGRRDLASLAGAAGIGAKVWALHELLQLYPSEPVLVFSEFPESVEAIGARLAEWGEPAVWWHGRLGAEARTAALAAFRGGERRILVDTDALAEGQNLQHCRIIVNVDLPWNPFRIEQRIGRVHRLGQRREVFVLSLVARDTFEAALARLFIDRLHLFELAVGELDPVLGDLADSEADLEGFLLRIALAEGRDRERELASFARTLEDGYLRYRAVTRRHELLPDLGAVAGR
jgi:superfamily II DNA or RNA helicase